MALSKYSDMPKHIVNKQNTFGKYTNSMMVSIGGKDIDIFGAEFTIDNRYHKCSGCGVVIPNYYSFNYYKELHANDCAFLKNINFYPKYNNLSLITANTLEFKNNKAVNYYNSSFNSKKLNILADNRFNVQLIISMLIATIILGSIMLLVFNDDIISDVVVAIMGGAFIGGTTQIAYSNFVSSGYYIKRSCNKTFHKNNTYKGIKIDNIPLNYYHEYTNQEMLDICHSLNEAVNNNDSASVQQIIDNIEKMDEISKNNKNKHDYDIAMIANKEREKRNKNNKVLAGVIKGNNIANAVEETDSDKLEAVFSSIDYEKILKLNNNIKKYDSAWNDLSQYDKNMLKNCATEYSIHVKNIIQLIDKDLGIDDSVKGEFIKLVDNCNIILSMINSNLIERNKDNITVTNMYLQGKYPVIHDNILDGMLLEKNNSNNGKVG